MVNGKALFNTYAVFPVISFAAFALIISFAWKHIYEILIHYYLFYIPAKKYRRFLTFILRCTRDQTRAILNCKHIWDSQSLSLTAYMFF